MKNQAKTIPNSRNSIIFSKPFSMARDSVEAKPIDAARHAVSLDIITQTRSPQSIDRFAVRPSNGSTRRVETTPAQQAPPKAPHSVLRSSAGARSRSNSAAHLRRQPAGIVYASAVVATLVGAGVLTVFAIATASVILGILATASGTAAALLLIAGVRSVRLAGNHSDAAGNSCLALVPRKGSAVPVGRRCRASLHKEKVLSFYNNSYGAVAAFFWRIGHLDASARLASTRRAFERMDAENSIRIYETDRIDYICVNARELFFGTWQRLQGTDPIAKAAYMQAVRMNACVDLSIAFEHLGKTPRLSSAGLDDLRWLLDLVLAPKATKPIPGRAETIRDAATLRQYIRARIAFVHPDRLFLRDTDMIIFDKLHLSPDHEAKCILRVLDMIREMSRDDDLCNRIYARSPQSSIDE